MTDKTWLEEALEITTGERRRDYGRPLINFADIAIAETWYLLEKLKPDRIITPVDVVMLNNQQKAARQKHTFKTDNFVDIIGYAACVDDMNRQMIELGYLSGVKAFEDMTSLGELEALMRRLTQGN